MKYTQYSRNKKGSSAFYIIIALCLVLVGVAAWFAFTRMDTAKPKGNLSSMESEFESNIDEYTDNNDSYTDSEPQDVLDFTESDTASEEITNEEYVSKKETVKEKAYSMPINGEILKDFSTSALQYSSTYGDMRIHAAVDIACSEGTLVGACTDGKIQDIEETSDFGKIVTIDHGDGLVIKYCGLKNITVEKDTAVRMGDSIGAVGTIPCECSDQSHLHLEAYQNGKSISILKFFE